MCLQHHAVGQVAQQARAGVSEGFAKNATSQAFADRLLKRQAAHR